MKFTDSIVFALAATALAGSSGSQSTLKTAACKSRSSKPIPGSASLGVSSVAPSRSAVSSKLASSKVSSGLKVSSSVPASRPSSSASSGRPAVSSRVSSRVPSGSASSGRRTSSVASSSAGSGGSGGNSGNGGSGSSGLNGSCPPAATSTITVSGDSGSTITVTASGGSGSTVTVTVSGGSGPSPTTQSSCDPSASPLPPSQDPWYQAPAGYEAAAPGAVLKVRNACGLVPVVANSSAAYQILYRTTNSLFNPTWAVTTILVPVNATNSLLSYQYPYDSAAIDSSPSYSLYGNGGLFGIGDITAALGRGVYVITPDYESWQASFVAGTVSGLATLDSLRAAIGPNTPVPQLSNATYALWGYSGGALASEWALEYQQQYAPELNIAGAALGGLTPDIRQVLYTVENTIYVGLSFSGILGLSSQYADLDAYVQSQLKQEGPHNATGFNAAKNYTLAQAIGAYAGQSVASYFTSGIDALNASISQRVIGENNQGYHGIPKPPLFVYKAIGDDISPVNDTDALVNKYCAVGATINYERNTVGNHATELPNGAPRAVAFLNSIFAGTYSASGCQISNVSVSV